MAVDASLLLAAWCRRRRWRGIWGRHWCRRSAGSWGGRRRRIVLASGATDAWISFAAGVCTARLVEPEATGIVVAAVNPTTVILIHCRHIAQSECFGSRLALCDAREGVGTCASRLLRGTVARRATEARVDFVAKARAARLVEEEATAVVVAAVSPAAVVLINRRHIAQPECLGSRLALCDAREWGDACATKLL